MGAFFVSVKDEEDEFDLLIDLPLFVASPILLGVITALTFSPLPSTPFNSTALVDSESVMGCELNTDFADFHGLHGFFYVYLIIRVNLRKSALSVSNFSNLAN